ncbi:MAG: tetratricopeptide repeat protein [Deltaproteobacteria bacterium]|nr:tetratricopeptide repeat protein [Deltaproteobacteria bacterium]
MKFFYFILIAGVFAGCAQRLDEFEERTNELQKRISQMEHKSGLPVGSDRELLDSQKLADVRSQMASMRNDMTVMSGKMEALEYENKNLNQRMDSLALELEKRGAKTEGPSVPAAVNPAPQDAESAYHEALKAHQDGDFSKAEKLFEAFVRKYPKNSLAPSALFWIGDGHMAEKSYKKAIVKFQTVIDKYPKSEKRCEAMDKQISCLQALKMEKEASAFQKLYAEQCSAKK